MLQNLAKLVAGRSTRPTANKPLRILVVTGAYPTEHIPHWGTFIKSQVESLQAAGIEVEVLHPKAGPTLLRYVSAAVRVFCKTLTRQFDIVHGHYGLWCLVARMQWTTPVVASFLGDDLLGTVTDRGTYSAKSRVVMRISRWLAYGVDAVIVKSEQMMACLPGRNVVVVPNGVDFQLFHPIPRAQARAALVWDSDGCYILFGNNPRIPVKDFPLAQAAIECLRARGLSAALVVANGLPQTTLVQYINASNVLLLSSKAEGSPNVVKEAMACNVPVVATDVGDVAKVIARTEGCYVCPHDAEALAAALMKALSHRQPTTGRLDMHHLERSAVAQQVITIYEQVTSAKHLAMSVAAAAEEGGECVEGR